MQIVIGLIAAAVGLYFFERVMWRPAPKSEIASEAPEKSPPLPPARPSTEDVRQPSHAIASASSASHEEEAPAPAPAKSPPPVKSPSAQRDPAIDGWFIKTYLRCWTPPAALPPGEKYAAQIRVRYDSDGSLAAAPVLVNPPSDPEWRSYADSAIHAVTKCNPLQVPSRYAAHFEQWKKMTLHF